MVKLPKGVKPVHIFIGLFIVVTLIFITSGMQSTVYTGTIVSLSPVDYTNNLIDFHSSAQFQKAFLSQVMIGTGGQYLTGVQSNTIQGKSADSQTKSKDTFNVKFQLNDLSCRYPVSQAGNTISLLSIQEYQPQLNQIFTTGWNADCSISAAAKINSKIYYDKQIGTDPISGTPLYCNALPTANNQPASTSYCYNDFVNKCPAGYQVVSCTVPTNSPDSIWAIFAGTSTQGVACARIIDAKNTINWTMFTLNPMNPKASASIVVTDNTNNNVASPITLGAGGGVGTQSAGNNYVYSEMNTVATSFNQQCPSETSSILIKQNAAVPNYGLADAVQYNNVKQTYGNYKQTLPSSDMVQVISSVATLNNQISLLANTNTYSKLKYSATDGQVVYDMKDAPPFFPIINLWINADWVGIVSPLAVPQVSSISPNPITTTSGQEATGTITITNTGSTAGAIAVDLPTCTPSTPTFRWINNPSGRNYNAYENYQASFGVNGNEGTYSCYIKARPQGISFTGQGEVTSPQFQVKINTACPQPTYPRILSPTTDDPCRIICPLDPRFNSGQDVCAASGLQYDSTQCKCIAKPSCQITNTCPATQCSDGTPVAVCQQGNTGMKCIVKPEDITNAILVQDSSCSGGNNQTIQCYPLIQYPATITTGGVVIPVIGNIGGTQNVFCQTDYLTLGGIVVVVIVVAYFATQKRRRR